MFDFLLNPIFDDNMLKQVAFMGDWGIVLIGLVKSMIIITLDTLAVSVILLVVSFFYGCYKTISHQLARLAKKQPETNAVTSKMGRDIKAA